MNVDMEKMRKLAAEVDESFRSRRWPSVQKMLQEWTRCFQSAAAGASTREDLALLIDEAVASRKRWHEISLTVLKNRRAGVEKLRCRQSSMKSVVQGYGRSFDRGRYIARHV